LIELCVKATLAKIAVVLLLEKVFGVASMRETNLGFFEACKCVHASHLKTTTSQNGMMLNTIFSVLGVVMLD
jgi:hypothetical protein